MKEVLLPDLLAAQLDRAGDLDGKRELTLVIDTET
jgi:hypothetical protein